MFGEVSEHPGGVRNVSESERNGSDHFLESGNHFRKVVIVIGRFRKVSEGSGSFRASRKITNGREHKWDPHGTRATQAPHVG